MVAGMLGEDSSSRAVVSFQISLPVGGSALAQKSALHGAARIRSNNRRLRNEELISCSVAKQIPQRFDLGAGRLNDALHFDLKA
jgi:hypothetical protein